MSPRRWLALAAASLAACQAPAAQTETAALIVNADAASRAALQQAVGAMLGQSAVTLADDALTGASVLLIERRAVYDARGLRVDGREPGKPERFDLLTRGGSCVLMRARDGRRVVLAQTHCRPVPP